MALSLKDRARGIVKEWEGGIRSRLQVRSVERRNPVLVYQMGKVGSSTVAEVLRQSGVAPVFQIHTLTREGVQHAVERQRRSMAPSLPEHLLLSKRLLKKLEARQFPCNIITLTREPIARAISFVFEDWKKQIPDTRHSGGYNVEQVNEKIISMLSSSNGNADPTQWFDRELRKQFGIDVFESSYDHVAGHTIIDAGDVRVLVMRLEDMEHALVPALNRFLGLSVVAPLEKGANVGADKDYAAAMGSVKNTLRLPGGLIDQITSTKYFRHFYSNEEERVRARWCVGE